jgi:hypothetical protein
MTQNFFSLKNSIWVSKNTEFHADFESIEKVVTKCTEKSYKQNKFDEHEYSEKSAYFCKVFLITFFGAFFQNFLNGYEISVKFCVF